MKITNKPYSHYWEFYRQWWTFFGITKCNVITAMASLFALLKFSPHIIAHILSKPQSPSKQNTAHCFTVYVIDPVGSCLTICIQIGFSNSNDPIQFKAAWVMFKNKKINGMSYDYDSHTHKLIVAEVPLHWLLGCTSYCTSYLYLLFVPLICCTAGRDWKWGGCSDNVAFGQRISKQYIDELETGKDERAIVNLHNNEAGRRVSIALHFYTFSLAVSSCYTRPSIRYQSNISLLVVLSWNIELYYVSQKGDDSVLRCILQPQFNQGGSIIPKHKKMAISVFGCLWLIVTNV